MNPAEQFVADCRTIVRGRGQETKEPVAYASVGWGLDLDGAKVYQDKLVEIVVEKDPSQAMLVTKRSNRNPVVCTDKDGKPYRQHGEWRDIAAHVRMLVVGA